MLYGMAPTLFNLRREVESDLARAEAGRKLADHRANLREFEDRFDQLTLICMAVWSLLEEKIGLTEEDLAARVKEIDLADGKQDGKIRRTIKKCVKCGRTMSPRHNRCLYCGGVDLSQGPFDAAM